MPITSSVAALLIAAVPQTATGAPPAAALPATAQPQDVAPPPEFMQAAQAFGQCIGQTSQALPATTAPEAGAKQALAGCATQKTTLETRFETWVSGPGFPEAGRATAREQFRTQMAGVEPQIAERLRTARAAPAPTATPTPNR